MIVSLVQQLSREERLSCLKHNISGQCSYDVLRIHSGNAHGHVSTCHSCSEAVEIEWCSATQARVLDLLI